MPLRIAFVIDPWLHPFNGTVVSTRRFAAALRHAGVELTLLIAAEEGAASVEPSNAVALFERMSFPGFDGLLSAMRVPIARPDRRLIREVLAEQDIVHIHFPFFLGRAALSEARKLQIPVVCSFHVQPENILLNIGIRNATLRNLLYNLFNAAFYNRADLVFAPSAFAAQRLREQGVHTPIRILSNGIPDRFFTVSHSNAPRDGESDAPLRVLSVGRLAAEKHLDTLVRAVGLSRFKERVRLRLIGQGPMEASLGALAASCGVHAAIGPAADSDLMQSYAEADLFVHCGAVELEGMSVLEAMATGNAVLVSDSSESACAGLVTNKRAQFKSGDTLDLARKLDDWLAVPEALRAEGSANREHARAFRHEASLAKLIESYAELAARRRPFERAQFGGAALRKL